MRRLRPIGPRLHVIETHRVKLPPKTADPFYRTPEYQAWRADVIAAAGGRCQDPACKTPHRTGITLFADHIAELKDGGAPLDRRNGLARCGSCHSRKTAAARAARLADRPRG